VPSALSTRWGRLQEDEGDLFLNDHLVLEIEPEGHFYVVTAEKKGRYVARWVDEDGESHERIYASARGALDCARNSWGR